ncbi:hypothetical protein B566_EDAN011913 [Ephemera danica]|nr:hypothetical protein B566_EDAN011913 [Ephemera danica]
MFAGAEAAPKAVGEALLKPKSPGRFSDLPRVLERPYFDDVSPRNVTAVVGQSAVLNCRVKHVGDRTVSTLPSVIISQSRVLIKSQAATA